MFFFHLREVFVLCAVEASGVIGSLSWYIAVFLLLGWTALWCTVMLQFQGTSGLTGLSVHWLTKEDREPIWCHRTSRNNVDSRIMVHS